ncbi:MAG: outer membrane beta-barrel protein [Roseiarcus sp.]|jgi:outer membrane immunogenic protein
MRKYWLASAAASALAAGAFASSLLALAAPPSAPPPLFNWIGCYIGLHAGGDFGASAWSAPDYAGNFSTSGLVGGGQVGCAYQAQSFVIGAEGEVWGSGLTGSKWVADYEGYFESRGDVAGDVALRAGYAIDRTLLFGKVGLAVARYDYNYASVDQDENSTTGATHAGLLLGLGVEYALDRRWSIKGEYDYINYGVRSATFALAHDPLNPSFNASFKNEENIVKAGVNYRF